MRGTKAGHVVRPLPGTSPSPQRRLGPSYLACGKVKQDASLRWQDEKRNWRGDAAIFAAYQRFTAALRRIVFAVKGWLPEVRRCGGEFAADADGGNAAGEAGGIIGFYGDAANRGGA